MPVVVVVRTGVVHWHVHSHTGSAGASVPQEGASVGAWVGSSVGVLVSLGSSVGVSVDTGASVGPSVTGASVTGVSPGAPVSPGKAIQRKAQQRELKSKDRRGPAMRAQKQRPVRTGDSCGEILTVMCLKNPYFGVHTRQSTI